MDRMEAASKGVYPVGLAASSPYVAYVNRGEPVFQAQTAAKVTETTLSMRHGELAAVAGAAWPAQTQRDCRHGRAGDGGR